jgi:hypothetical protein
VPATTAAEHPQPTAEEEQHRQQYSNAAAPESAEHQRQQAKNQPAATATAKTAKTTTALPALILDIDIGVEIVEAHCKGSRGRYRCRMNARGRRWLQRLWRAWMTSISSNCR